MGEISRAADEAAHGRQKHVIDAIAATTAPSPPGCGRHGGTRRKGSAAIVQAVGISCAKPPRKSPRPWANTAAQRAKW